MRADDKGETLLELLVAVVILGVAVVAVVGGIGASIMMSDIHRKQATAGAYARDYAEAIENYVAAGNYNETATPSYSAATIGFTVSSGFAASVTSVKCWNGTGFVTCPTGNGIEQLTLQVASTDNRASERLVLVIRKPCGSGSACT
jgi:type II secretory pathway pseudopilin PulG